MFDIFNKKQMYDSVLFTGQDNASKNWNCNIQGSRTIFKTKFHDIP